MSIPEANHVLEVAEFKAITTATNTGTKMAAIETGSS